MVQSGVKRSSRSGSCTPLRTPTRRRLELCATAVGEVFEGDKFEDQGESRVAVALNGCRPSVGVSLGCGSDVRGTPHGDAEEEGLQQLLPAVAPGSTEERLEVSPAMQAVCGRSAGGLSDLSPSLCSDHLEVHGFSHLRESISFAFPQMRGSAQGARSSCEALEVRSALVPPSTSRSSAPSSRTSRRPSRHHKQQMPDRGSNRDTRKCSDLSFLSSGSAVAFIGSTVPALGARSPRGSTRSSHMERSHNSFSTSTLGPLDLSPIPKENGRSGGRRSNGWLRSKHQPPPNWPPIDVSVALADRADSVALSTEVGRMDSEFRREFRLLLAYCIRLVVLFAVTCFAVVFAVFLTSPLVVRESGNDGLFVRQYVESVAELQLIYTVPRSSLVSSKAKQLYLRMLSESLERLDRAASSVRPSPSDGLEVHDEYYRKMVRAYQVVRHRVALYARSRHRSWFYRNVLYPLNDAWRYGIVRHGIDQLLDEGFKGVPLYSLLARVKDIAVCLRQDENLPCPTLSFLNEQLYGISDSGKFWSYHGEGQHSPDGHLAAISPSGILFAYVSKSFRRDSREYNHLHLEEDVFF